MINVFVYHTKAFEKARKKTMSLITCLTTAPNNFFRFFNTSSWIPKYVIHVIYKSSLCFEEEKI